MAKVGVRWLEPEKDIGKTTFVKVSDLICDRSKDLPSGTVIRAKWKSTGRVYKATLLNNLMAKSKPKQSSRASQPEVSRAPDNTKPDSDDDDDDDDVPLAYQTATVSDTKRQVEEDSSQVKELKDKVVRLEDQVATMASELQTMKNFLINEFQGLKNALSQASVNNTQQFQAVLEAVSQSHGTIRETQDLIKGRVAARKKTEEQQRSLLNDNGKRIQPAFGLVENGQVTSYKNERKLFSVDREQYRRMFDDSKTATSFLRKLLKQSFSDEELSESNFSGGSVASATGMIVKKCLDRDRVLALLGQVELEFPNSTKAVNFPKMRDAINEECRRVVRHLRQEGF